MELQVKFVVDSSRITERDIRKELRKLKAILEEEYDATIYDIQVTYDYDNTD